MLLDGEWGDHVEECYFLRTLLRAGSDIWLHRKWATYHYSYYTKWCRAMFILLSHDHYDSLVPISEEDIGIVKNHEILSEFKVKKTSHLRILKRWRKIC